MLKITLFDINKDLCDAWEREFNGVENVTILNQELKKIPPHDLLVTAGNSYGIMSGGIDYYVNELCKFKVEPLVKEQIENYWGKLPVGKFVTVDIEKISKKQFKTLIYAPTMETPQRISKDNLTKVFYSILEQYLDTDYTLACCGLGTLTGGISPENAAKGMKTIYDMVLKEKKNGK